ncbi:hypothetical protein [Nostoc sp. FACHB-145]|uniref:hypothetical protein n=1 Tax=Nostoc sp. FACHB-145 TaxID=2692836 RepID=UPI001686B889|nr:hypothetical protein [Nostoc sp. FACHB-145]MBD2473308.1 hypothetical protein [Nostoc sp. FACHB-145]
MAKDPIQKLNAAKSKWMQITGYPPKVSFVKMCLPDFGYFDFENISHWRKAIDLFQKKYIKSKKQLLLHPLMRPLTPARQEWVKTTGLKASLQSVIEVLPECKFPLKTERDWFLVTSLYVQRYPEKVLSQDSTVKVIKEEDEVIQTKPLNKTLHDFQKLEPIGKPLPVLQPSTQFVSPSPLKDPAEQRMSDKLAEKLKGIREAANPSGRVDVLTKLYVIEVKKAGNWKHGIGQALVYQFYYSVKKPVLFLFGDDVDLYRDLAKKHCHRLGVIYREESHFLNKEF